MALSKFKANKLRILLKEGYPFKQAIAMAYDKKKKGDEGLTTDEGALSSLIDRMRDRREKIKAAKDFYLKEEENPFMDEEGRIMFPESGNKEREITPRQYKNWKRWQFRNYKKDLRKADREARQQDRQERQDERVKDSKEFL